MIALWLAYARERLRPAVFVPVIAGLTTAGWWSAGSPPAPGWLVSLAITGVLVVELRVWDDLADRDRDRHRHPLRVVVRSPRGPFVTLVVVAGVAAMAVASLSGGPTAAFAVVAIHLAGLAGYALVRPRVREALWTPLLLSKYPALVVVASLTTGSPSWWRLAVAGASTYTAAFIYERITTPHVAAPVADTVRAPQARGWS